MKNVNLPSPETTEFWDEEYTDNEFSGADSFRVHSFAEWDCPHCEVELTAVMISRDGLNVSEVDPVNCPFCGNPSANFYSTDYPTVFRRTPSISHSLQESAKQLSSKGISWDDLICPD